MDNIHIKEGEYSPEIDFDFEKRTFRIKGNSYPENASKFYEPVMDKLFAFLEQQNEVSISFTFDFIYFSSSTAKILMYLFEELDNCAENGSSVDITWLYEDGDEDMQELGEEFGEDLEQANFKTLPRSTD